MSRGGRGRGRSRRRAGAGAGAWWPAVALVGPLLGLVGACASPYEPLEVGQCLPPGAGVVGERAQDPERTPCTQPHRYQVYARRDLEPPGPGWPGDELVLLNAKRLCGLSVRDATGLDPRDLPDGVKVVQVAPSESSWRDGDREVECLFRWDATTTDTLLPEG